MEYSCTAPGKVLVTGGYLVLERPNRGAVLALSAQFQVSVSKGVATGSGTWPLVEVSSPQFRVTQQYAICWSTPGDGRGGGGGGGGPAKRRRVEAGDAADEAGWDPNSAPCVWLERRSEAGVNPFVECALVVVFRCALDNVKSKGGALNDVFSAWDGARITILGDNSFYSQPLPDGPEDRCTRLQQLPPHRVRSTVGFSGLQKTGLGSSAALTTALVGALLLATGVVEDPAQVNRRDAGALARIHNCAQLAHCAAQGKIGSGFDVSSAVYGCQTYARFSADCLAPLLDKVGLPERGVVDASTLSAIVATSASAGAGLSQTQSSPHVGSIAVWPESCTRSLLSQQWDSVHDVMELPAGMDLLMGDVSQGSETPGMVSKVLAWRRTNPDQSEALWRRLNGHNDAVERGLRQCSQTVGSVAKADETGLSRLHSELDSEFGPDSSGSVTADQLKGAKSSFLRQLWAVRQEYVKARALLKECGQRAGTDIEPDPQTALADRTMALPGVLMAGVPGAGGFDAVVAILFDSRARPAVEHHWEHKEPVPVISLPVSVNLSGGIQCKIS